MGPGKPATWNTGDRVRVDHDVLGTNAAFDNGSGTVIDGFPAGVAEGWVYVEFDSGVLDGYRPDALLSFDEEDGARVPVASRR